MRRTLGLWALVGSAASWAATAIPEPPSGENYLYDRAGLLSEADAAALRALQHTALEQYNSPLVVVTVGSAFDYGESSVEALATQWFNTWNIGTLGLQGGANQGMLLLVAVRDRRARIELGADWGHAWDGHAQRIMQGTIIPRFKAGDFSAGVVAGAEALLAMAKQGRNSRPPGDFLERRVRPLCKYSFFGPLPFLVLAGLGLALALFGAFGTTPPARWLIGLGVGLIVFSAFTYVLVAILAVFLRRGGGRVSGGGGRGYSGGFSGGGGASGSW